MDSSNSSGYFFIWNLCVFYMKTFLEKLAKNVKVFSLFFANFKFNNLKYVNNYNVFNLYLNKNFHVKIQ